MSKNKYFCFNFGVVYLDGGWCPFPFFFSSFLILNFFLLIRGILRIPNEIFSYFESSCRSILLCFSSLRRGSWRIPCRCTANSDYILGDTALRTHSSSRRYNPRRIYIIDDRTVAQAKIFLYISSRRTGSKRIPYWCTEKFRLHHWWYRISTRPQMSSRRYNPRRVDINDDRTVSLRNLIWSSKQKYAQKLLESSSEKFDPIFL